MKILENLGKTDLKTLPTDNNHAFAAFKYNTKFIYNDTFSSISPALDSEYFSNENAKRNSNQAISLSAAGIRALVYQVQTLYLRTPIKLFRPSRFDYLAYVRAIADRNDNLSNKPYKFRTHSTIGMMVNVLKKEGWKFIPDQVLPPLIANSVTGAILYTTYLTTLDRYNKQRQSISEQQANFNWYSPFDTWRAGFIAGSAQSLAAAPVDAIYARSSVSEMLEGSHQNLWIFGFNKLKEIGLIGVFAGYGFSLIKESLGFAFYFSTFEVVKTRGYYITSRMITYYRQKEEKIKHYLQKTFNMNAKQVDDKLERLERYRSAKLLQSFFILVAGASAAFSLLAVQYPITKVQKIHLSRLEALDIFNASKANNKPFIKLYYNSYLETFKQVYRMKSRARITWFEAAYSGFVKNALSTIPATSVALLVFEMMRTKLSDEFEGTDRMEP